MTENPRLWGYALNAPRRPPIKKQLEILGAFGLDTAEDGPIWRDEIPKIKPGPRTEETELTMRADLLDMVKKGDRVIVAKPECLGVSAKDACGFIAGLKMRGVTLMVCDNFWRIPPDGDAKELIAEVERRHNRVYRRHSRAKKRKQQQTS
jgi:hypothetical protein